MDFRFGSKAVLCGRGQFESPALSKNDESGPEQVSGAIVAAPPSIKKTRFRARFLFLLFSRTVIRLCITLSLRL